MNDSNKPKVFIFSDGSKESEVLEYETLKNPFIQIEKVKISGPNPQDIETYLQRLPKSVLNSNDITKVHLHFTREDFIENNIAEQRNKIASKYPNLSVFYAYEHLSRESATYRHAGYYPPTNPVKDKETEPKTYLKDAITDEPVKKFKKSK